ncbi:MAG: tRNA lysidine(34) synthetase TilS [Lachnospiraceae bacterium]
MSFDIKAVHVEHGIRGEESRQDAVYVEALCQKQNVEYECVSVDIPAMAVTEKLSTEEAGRLARYQIFEEISKSWHADKIAVAHNQNDQAETILWNLARGSGLDGAAGIRPVRDRIIRPLLECSRPEIEAYLKQKSITWREDRTNQELDYTRNIIRNCLLPEMAEKLNTGTIQHLAQFGTEMQQTREFLQELVEEACQKIARVRPGQVQIDLHQMKKEKEFLQERIIRFCMKGAGCGLKDIQRTHIQSVRELMEKQSGRQIQLPGGWLVRRTFDQLVIEQDAGKNEEIQQQKILLKIPGETQTPWGTFTTKIISMKISQFHKKSIRNG